MPKKDLQTKTMSLSTTGTKIGVATLALALSAGLAFAAIPASMKIQKLSKEKQTKQEQMVKKGVSKETSVVPIKTKGISCPAVASISGESCNETYRNTSVVCHDGTRHELDACTTDAEGKELLLGMCESSCSATSGKCGVDSYYRGTSCEGQYSNTTVTCHDGSTRTLDTGSCQTPDALQEAAVEVCGCDVRTECTDSDGGDDRFVQGRISGEFSPGDEGAQNVIDHDYTEYCVNENTVAENFCSSTGYITGADRNCRSGYTCETGACIAIPNSIYPLTVFTIPRDRFDRLFYGETTFGSLVISNSNGMDAEIEEISVTMSILGFDAVALDSYLGTSIEFITLAVHDEYNDIIVTTSIPFSELITDPEDPNRLNYEGSVSFDDDVELQAANTEVLDFVLYLGAPLLSQDSSNPLITIRMHVGETITWTDSWYDELHSDRTPGLERFIATREI